MKIKKILLILTIILFNTFVFAVDEKPGRFFEDQPDVTDDYQIHFNYVLAADSEDREWDINGKMEKILLELNEAMAKATAEHKKGDGVVRKYKFDYRKDGKLDITFVRLDKKHKELHKWANNDIFPFLNKVVGMKNVKKHYYNFADFNNVDGGEAGVGYGTTYVRNSSNHNDEQLILVTLHEFHHSMGGGYNCVPGMGGNGHYSNRDKEAQLNWSRKLGSTYAHGKPDCPQLQDVVFLTPTSKTPYDPYEINCLFKLGKYTNKKIMKVVNKMKKAKKIKGNMKFGSNCRYMDWDRSNNKGGFYIWGVEENIMSTLK